MISFQPKVKRLIKKDYGTSFEMVLLRISVKMLSTMVGRQRKIKKKHWLKRPSAVPKKRNLNQNINYSKSHIWNSFFENSISGIQSSYICPDVSVGIIWVSLKKLYSFLTYLTLKILCSRNRAKNLSDFINVPASMFLCSVRKNVCTTPFLDAQQLHFWSTLKANVCIFLHISPKNFCFRDVVSKVLSGGGEMGETE